MKSERILSKHVFLVVTLETFCGYFFKPNINFLYRFESDFLGGIASNSIN